ncbi:MAG: 1-acyl-sn-glycerol-3-phosphate acyltransferase [Verrucomicrobiae bacterium]|nr:1-acyl-sn-glycerol-3-phosphate acyltransferase [Verrucomicrobiae bacterium]
MLDFCDAPYRFFPARPSLIMMSLCRWVNARWSLPGPNHRIRHLLIDGATDSVKAIEKRGERILYVPNHSTHSDPQVMTEVQRRLGTPSCFMAAYDVFLRGRINGWVMQRAGAFSVDREGSDRKSMAEALKWLNAGRFGLTIFPEGNVYMTNDRVTPFLEGAAFLALKAQKDLGDGRPIHVVPVSIKLSHISDVRQQVRERLGALAALAGEPHDDGNDPVEELVRIGRDLLGKNLRQRGYLRPDEDITEGHLVEVLRTSVDRIASGLETKIGLEPKNPDDLTDRLRKIRAAIHQIRSDPEKEAEHRVAASWADEAILAMRILGYANPYVTEKSTLDRFAETVEKLHEDSFGRWERPFGLRDAMVSLGEPINLAAWLRDSAEAGKSRQAVNGLTRTIEDTVQSGLDAINAGNDREGAKPF